MIPAVQMPTAEMRQSIQGNLQLGRVFIALHTWTTIWRASLVVTTSSISSTMRLIYTHHFLQGGESINALVRQAELE